MTRVRKPYRARPSFDIYRTLLWRNDTDLVDALVAAIKATKRLNGRRQIAAAADRLAWELERRTRERCPASKREWYWTLDERARIAGDIKSVAMSLDRFAELIRAHCEIVLYEASYKTNSRHWKHTDALVEYDPRCWSMKLALYGALGDRNIAMTDYNRLLRAVMYCGELYIAVMGPLDDP